MNFWYLLLQSKWNKPVNKRTNTLRVYSQEIPSVIKLVESEDKMVVARGQVDKKVAQLFFNK
jgi:hypothetical protein